MPHSFEENLIKICWYANTKYHIIKKTVKGSDTMALVAQAIRNQEILKTEYSEKAAIGALYDELSKGIESLKKGDVYTIDEAWEEIDKI